MDDIQLVDKETLSTQPDWVFPQYFGDSRWGKNPTLHCNDCTRWTGDAKPTDALIVVNREGRDFLACEDHAPTRFISKFKGAGYAR